MRASCWSVSLRDVAETSVHVARGNSPDLLRSAAIIDLACKPGDNDVFVLLTPEVFSSVAVFRGSEGADDGHYPLIEFSLVNAIDARCSKVSGSSFALY